MNTKQFLVGILLAGATVTLNAQTIVETSTLTSGGLNAGTAGGMSTYYGKDAGKITGQVNNTFIGHETGAVTTQGHSNTFVGSLSGTANTIGRANAFFGYNSGVKNTTGDQNTYIGTDSGRNNERGTGNVFIGAGAGAMGSLSSIVNNSNSIFVGSGAGRDNTGSNNICIGPGAGSGQGASHRLFISNSNDNTPLIWGDFVNDKLVFNGRVGITDESFSDQSNLFPTMAGGVDVSAYKLFVKGGILTEAMRVSIKSPSNWADYVFEDDYNLASLDEVECFIEENGHLPNVPSAEQVYRDGIELAEMAKIQQEKIEELTLYLIQQKKEIEELKARMDILMAQKK